MRLFIGVRPPEAVLDQVAELVEHLQGALSGRSPAGGALRWAGREQWHVTLRFLGEMDGPEPVIAALDDAVLPPAEAVLGPAAELLGSQVLCVPVAGLDELAAGVVAATTELGQPPDDRPFRGHVTVARIGGRRSRRGRRGRGPVSARDLGGAAIEARWPVDEVALVRSRLGSGAPRYEELHRRPLLH